MIENMAKLQEVAANISGVAQESRLGQVLKEKAGFDSHPAGFEALALKKNGDIDSKKTVNILDQANVIPQTDKKYVRDMLDGKGIFKDIPEADRAKMFNEGLQTGNFRQEGADFLNKHKGMQGAGGYDSVVLDKNGEIDAGKTVDMLAKNKIISGKDKNEVRDLLEGKGHAEHVPADARAELYNRIIKHENSAPGKGLNAHDAIDMANKLGKEGKTKELDTYLKQVGAREAGPTFESGKNTKIDGVSDGFDLSAFREYTITAKDENGKKVKIKVNQEDALKGNYEPGKLRGIDAALEKHGISDLSSLKDVKIDGRLDNDKPYKVNTKDMNEIADGTKDWEDVRKKGFFEKLGDGIKGVFKGIGDVVAAPFKAIGNTVGGVINALKDGKNIFDAVGDGLAKGAGSFADSIKSGLANAVDGISGIAGSVTGAIFGDKVGNVIDKGLNFVGDVASGFVTSLTDGAKNIAEGLNDISDGNGNFFKNILKVGSGALEFALLALPGAGVAVKAGKNAGTAAKTAANTGKALDKATDAAQIAKTADKANDAAKVGKAADKANDAAKVGKAADKTNDAGKVANGADKASDAGKVADDAAFGKTYTFKPHDKLEIALNPAMIAAETANGTITDTLASEDEANSGFNY